MSAQHPFPAPGPPGGPSGGPSGDPTPTRPAATVLVARDADGGMELLLLRRHGRAGFAADAWVFPGGMVDAADGTLPSDRWRGIDPAALTERFALPPDEVLGMHVAAVRETFEEAGILLATGADGGPIDVETGTAGALRAALVDRTAGAADFAAWLEAEGVVLDLGSLTYAFRWVTPAQEPRRYDTCFFLVQVAAGQVAVHDAVEVTDQRWLTPAAALEEGRAGRLHLIYPTIKTLEALAGHATVAEAVGWARHQSRIRSIQPHLVVDDGGRYIAILHPDDPDYPHDAEAS
jgi:8-oxo-dGTP pyrophosphatase MutT (NUDIX family)